MNAMVMTDKKVPYRETILMMEVRHSHERAELIRRMTSEAYNAGINDRANPSIPAAQLPSIMEEVADRVSNQTGIDMATLRGPSSKRYLNEPRRTIWAELNSRGYSLVDIGRFFGRDHSTILYGINKFKDLADRKPEAG